MKKNIEALVKGNVDGLQGVTAPPAGVTISPPADIYETADAFVVLLDVPGTAKESISVSVRGSTLTISAPAPTHHVAHQRLVYRETVDGTYHREFALGEGVDNGKIDAAYAEGVLAIKLYKSEWVKAKEIEIR